MSEPEVNARPAKRTLIALTLATVALALVLLLDAFHILSGPLALLLVLVFWIALPTSHFLSRRLAINAGIGLGLFPMLWWTPWSSSFFSHTGVIIGILAGVLVFQLAWSAESRRAIVPRVSLVDFGPAAALVFCAWFFAPFFVYSSGNGAVSILTRAFGNDNIAHFDMFEMIRRTLTVGPNWPTPYGGSQFEYGTYPQHFHALAAFAAELWAGPVVHSVTTEVGLYGIGSALVLSVAIIALVASIVSVLRRHVVLALTAALGVVAFLLLGFGGITLTFGFAGYLLGMIGTALAIFLSLRRRTTIWALASIAACVVLAAHTWSLLAPITAVPVVIAIFGLPFERYRVRRRLMIAPAVIFVALIAAGAFAIYLVFVATSANGSPEAVLGTSGGVPAVKPIYALAPAVGVLVLGIAILLLRRRVIHPDRVRGGWVLTASAFVALAEGAILILIQIHRTGSLSYYQYKFLDAVFLIFGAVLVGALVFVASAFLGSRSRLGVSLSVFAIAVLLVAAVLPESGIKPAHLSSLRKAQPAGLAFRNSLIAAGSAPTSTSERLLKASQVMSTRPCARPTYVAIVNGDQTLGQPEQWAMSLSSTWTVASSEVDTTLFPIDVGLPKASADALVRKLLTGHSNRCAVVAPQVYQSLSSQTIAMLGSQIVSWKSR